MKVRFWVKTAVSALLVAATAGCGSGPEPYGEPDEVRYQVAAEERITLTSELPGRVSALVVAEVRPQVDGIILERLFEEGADVAKGQVLYQIDPAVYQAAYNTAKAALAEAEATVTSLALLEKRYRELVKTQAVGRQDLDNAVSDHARAKARIAGAVAELETAAINLAYTQIKAPVSGRIGASSVTPGALVTANQPETLAVVQQTDRVYVDVNQPGADTLRLRRAVAHGKISSESNEARVRLILEDGTPYTPLSANHESESPEWIVGRLLFSEISVSRSTGSVRLRALFNNPDGLLLPGMYVTAVIEEGTLDNAVLIPQSSALAAGSGGHMVYVLQKDDVAEDVFRVERREVTLGRAYGNRWVVASGLAAGERLVVEGLQKAVPGGLVKGVPAPLPQPRATGTSGSSTDADAR